MRWLVNYLRQCFCRHPDGFERSEKYFTVYADDGSVKRRGNRISLLCMKCGCHRSFWEV